MLHGRKNLWSVFFNWERSDQQGMILNRLLNSLVSGKALGAMCFWVSLEVDF